MKPLLSIVYVYYNTPYELIDSLSTLSLSAAGISYEVIIVDNASFIRVPQGIKSYRVKIIRNKKNIGYGAAVNRGVEQASGSLLLISNTDVLFKKDAIRVLVKKLQNDSTIGILGPQQVDQKGAVLQSFNAFPSLILSFFSYSFINKVWKNNLFSKQYWLRDLDRKKEQVVAMVGGACFVIRKSVFDKVSGFDKRFFMYFEEMDICKRLLDLGYKNVYYPKAQVVHLVGRSSSNKEWIETQFEKSRYLFFKKYYKWLPATITELLLRSLKRNSLFVGGVLFSGVFLNFYKLSSLMMFFGDFGRDYLAARDMLLTGNIPLVGIASSVKWLHQGPLSIYLIGIALFFGKFHPVAPAMLYGLLGVVTTYLVYVLGKRLFTFPVGILAALFYTTSPLFIVNTRMPYHTSLIPICTTIFFLLLHKLIQGNTRVLPFVFLSFGLLLQTELSNAVLGVILFVSLFIMRRKLSRQNYLSSLVGLTAGIFPFLLYDLTHGFKQTLGFPLWIAYRALSFFGVSIKNSTPSFHVQDALYRIYQQVTSAVFPTSPFITWSILVLVITVVVVTLFQRNNNEVKRNCILLSSWLCIPLLGFLVHAAPGTAYFPLLYPAVSILLGFTVYQLNKHYRISILLFLLLCGYNAFLTVTNDYFLSTSHSHRALPPENYGLGQAYVMQQELAKFIVRDAKGNAFTLKGGGFLATEPTSLDNYRYLVWYAGGHLSNQATQIYTFYESIQAIPQGDRIVYQNPYIYVTKK